MVVLSLSAVETFHAWAIKTHECLLEKKVNFNKDGSFAGKK